MLLECLQLPDLIPAIIAYFMDHPIIIIKVLRLTGFTFSMLPVRGY